MNTFVCPACGGANFASIVPYRNRSPHFANKDIYFCDQCKVGSVYPKLSNAVLSRYYDQYWGKNVVIDTKELMPLFHIKAVARFEYFKKFLPKQKKIRILDIGAGFGIIRKTFLSPIEYHAVEIDPDAAYYLKTVIKADGVYSSVDDTTGTFHLIILSHILEHMNDPSILMLEQAKHLSTGGIIFIEVPNSDYLYKNKYEPHLVFFTPNGLRRIVERTGYNVISVDTCGSEIQKLQKAIELRKKKGLVTGFRSVVKVLLSERAVKIINNIKRKTRYDSHFSYGADRRWIRLVAEKR